MLFYLHTKKNPRTQCGEDGDLEEKIDVYFKVICLGNLSS